MIHSIDHSPGRTLSLGGREYLYFGGTSYLGLQSDLEFQEMLVANIRKYGSSHGASRWSNLRLDIYRETEQYLASWCGSEAALTLSSGFLAGQLLANYFNQRGYKAFYAPNAHAAMLGNSQSPSPNFESLAGAITAHISKYPSIVPVLFTDSVDLSGKSYPNYEPLRNLPLEQIILVADDSHGLGVLGDNGEGTYRHLLALGPRELVVCGSLAKALGVQGGLILASSQRCAQLWDTPFFAGASPSPPAHMATLMEASGIYRDKRDQLLEARGTFDNLWKNRQGFSYMDNYPVIGYNNPVLTEKLGDTGILVSDFPYPSAQLSSLPARIVVSAIHQESDLRHLASALNLFVRG